MAHSVNSIPNRSHPNKFPRGDYLKSHLTSPHIFDSVTFRESGISPPEIHTCAISAPRRCRPRGGETCQEFLRPANARGGALFRGARTRSKTGRKSEQTRLVPTRGHWVAQMTLGWGRGGRASDGRGPPARDRKGSPKIRCPKFRRNLGATV